MLIKYRNVIVVVILFLISIGVWATVATLQSTSNSPEPMPTLADIAAQDTPILDETTDNPELIIEDTSDTTESIAISDIVIVESKIDIQQDPIADRYIVELSDGQSLESVTQLADELDVAVIETISELNRVVIVADASTITQLESESIISTEPDYYASALYNVPPSDPLYQAQWNMDMIGAPFAWGQFSADTPAIQVAVIDSGVCLDHPDIQGAYSDFQWDYIQNDAVPQDELGHGCGVAGIIASQNNDIGTMGVAPFAKIMPLRVLGANGIGTYSNIAQAIVDATNQGAQIINLSLGGYNDSNLLKSAIGYALANDVYVVAATGNDGGSQPLYPANYAGVIAVGSVNEAGNVSTFSNRGEDTLAPGEVVPVPYINNNYVYQSGTSFAAPHVAGVIALELALGQTPTIDGGIIGVNIDDAPIIEPTPAATEAPETITVNGRTIPYVERYEPQTSDRWVVQLQDNVDAGALANQLGFQNLGQVGELDNYYVFAQDGSGSSESMALSVGQVLSAAPQVIEFEQEFTQYREAYAVPTDPQVGDQWHLINTGQSGGTVGVDANVTGAWDDGYDGSGITIAVIDDGLEITHPDFSSKYNSAASFDFNGSDPVSLTDQDGNPSHEAPDSGHGTSAGGVAVADDDGTVCGVGVAYNAGVSGLRFLSDNGITTDSMEATTFNYAMQTNDVYTNSWGPANTGYFMNGPGPLAKDALINGVNNGRGGNGNIYVFAAGNSAEFLGHANANGYANSRYTIAVGATDYNGERSPYSELGTNLLVNAPSDIFSYANPNLTGGGIVTTDRLGTAGYNNQSGFSNNCTDNFGGTSSATPVVSGVIALMLDANPNLTWRDVQHILVETARKNDPTDPLWNTNDAGKDFNIQYGFGTVDASAAVAMAETWTTVDPEVSYSSGDILISAALDDGSGNFASNIQVAGEPVVSQHTVDDNINIESIEVQLDANHTYWGDLRFSITSPSGTTSFLYPARKFDSSSGAFSWTVSSMEFWGEDSAGVWTLVVEDVWAGDTGTVDGFALEIHGTPSDILVTTTTDENNGCTYASCSLREAIIKANAEGDGAVVSISAGTYTLSIAGTGEDVAATGDLDITANIHIVGAGRDQTIIDANGIDRVFDIYSSSRIEKLSITGGNAPNGENGGGIRILEDSGSAYTKLLDVAIHDNITTGNGGGIASNSFLQITYSDIYQNQAQHGGGIYNNGHLIMLLNEIYLHNNTATANGGGFYDDSDASNNVNIYKSTIANNIAVNGGGIHINGQYAEHDYQNITMSGNEASEHGGGIFVNDGQVGVTYSTITNNTADSTNSDNGDGGGIYVNLGQISIGDSILSDNIDLTEDAPDCYANNADTISGNFNVIGDLSGCTDYTLLNNPLFLERDYVGIDPLLELLIDNGGSTLTHAIPSNSVAVSNGNLAGCFNFIEKRVDQRGVIRDYSAQCDIGAYEYTGSNTDTPLQFLSFNIRDTSFYGNFDILNNQIGYGIKQALYETYINPGNIIVLAFNHAINDPIEDSDVSDVTNLSNYLLVADGTNGVFDTTSCVVSGDDVLISVTDVNTNALFDEVYLLLDDTLPIDSYRLVSCNLQAMNGALLDGNSDGIAGDSLIHDFAVAAQYPTLVEVWTNYFEDNEFIDGNPLSNFPTAIVPVPVRHEFDYAFEYFDAKFSSEVNATQANDSNNYLIVDYGADEVFQTNSCSVQGDDQSIPITNVNYDNVAKTAHLSIGSALVNGVYRVIVCDAIQDLSGNPIDGDYDFVAGNHHIAEFLLFPKPANVVATQTASQINILWDDLATSETGYAIERRLNQPANGWVEIGTTAANATSFVDTNIACDESYIYRVQTRRDTDMIRSGYSDEIAMDLDCSPMVDPTGLVTAISGTQVDLTWNDNNNFESIYEIERQVSGGGYVKIADAPANSSSYSDTMVICSDAYDYRVRAYRALDTSYSNYSNIASITTAICPPSSLQVNATIGQEELDLTWVDNSDDETEFRILRSITDTGGFVQIDTALADATSHTDTTLSCYTDYFYQVVAYRLSDDTTSAPSDIASAQTSCTTVTAPDSLTSDGTEDVTVLNWNDNSPDETNFEIQRSISGAASFSVSGTVATNITTYTDLTTVCGGEYDYRVRAYRAGDDNNSAFSNITNVKQICAPPPAPSDLTVSPIQFTNDLQLDWVDNSTTETDFYIERSTDGSGWAQIATVTENVITYTDTDAGLSCYTPYYYQIRAFRADDGVYSEYSNVMLATTWCDPDDTIVVVDGAFSASASTEDVSGVVGFPQPSCAPNISHAYVWELSENSPTFLNTFGSSFNTVLAYYTWDGTTLTEMGCNDEGAVDGTSALATNNASGLTELYIVSGKNNASGNIAFKSAPIVPPTATPLPTFTPIPTATDTPDLTTVGVFKNGIWQFRDANERGTADLTVRFGATAGSNWQPLIGDWNGDGIDGFGLYRNGRWILRDVIESGNAIDYDFMFGTTDSSWQPIGGDWDGDGNDGIGLYKDGVWMLKNEKSRGNADYQFYFKPSSVLNAIPIAGDWHDESKDRVGLYDSGRWYLSYDHRTNSNAKSFAYGPTDGTWLPIVGDWDEDGDDTIGVYKDGNWRLRNANTRGNTDIGLAFGDSGALPIAGYRGDAGGLALFVALGDVNTDTVASPTLLPTIDSAPSTTPVIVEETATIAPTDGVTATANPSTTPEVVEETATPVPTATLTPVPSSTPTAMPTATHTPTEVPPEIPDNTSGTE